MAEGIARRQRIREEIATGGAVASLRRRGYSWRQIKQALRLRSVEDAKTLAMQFVIATADFDRRASGVSRRR